MLETEGGISLNRCCLNPGDFAVHVCRAYSDAIGEVQPTRTVPTY